MKKNFLKVLGVGAGVFAATAANAASTGFTAVMDTVDLSGIDVKVIALGILAVGITIAFRGIYLSKRAVNMMG